MVFAVLVSLLLPAVSLSTGRIVLDPVVVRITVTDAEGRAVSGAECSLTVNGKTAATAVTDDSGVCSLVGMPVGSYALRVGKQGFDDFQNAALSVPAEGLVEIQVKLTVNSLSEKVTVENPADDPLSIESGSSPPNAAITGRAMERLPLATKRVDEAIPLVPGVIRSPNGQISINGATEQQSSFRLNGLNIADPASGNFRLDLPVDAVESVQVFRHPYSAEFGQFTGGVTDIATRRGGDKWHFEINDFLPDLRFHGGTFHGVQDDSPRVSFNGPLIKDKLFLFQSLSYNISKSPVRGLTFPNNETISEGQSYFTQLDWILSPRHSETFTAGYFPERQSYVGLDFFRQRPATPNYKQRDFVGSWRDSFAFKNGGLLQSSLSYKWLTANVWGQGTADQVITPVGEFGNYFSTQARRSNRFEFLETYDAPPVDTPIGVNNFKVGFDLSSVSNLMDYNARPVDVQRADGTLAERVTFDTVRPFRVSNSTYTGFVQDRLVVRPNLSFDIGVRIEDQRIAHERNLSPRAGFAWSPFKDDKTIVRGGFGYFYDKVPLNFRSFGSYPARTVTTFGPDGQTIVDQRTFENVLVSDAGHFPADLRQVGEEIGFVPQNLTWNLQVDRVINSFVDLRVNFTRSSTDQLYTANPWTDVNGRSAIVLSPSGRVKYDALEFTARFTLPEKQSFYVSYVRSRSRGNLNDFNSYFGDFAYPLIRPDQFSRLSTDVPNRFLAWGSIALPHKVTVSPIVEWRNGFPYSVLDQQQNFVGTRNAAGQSFPAFFSVDADVSKDFRITKGYSLRLSLKGFNLTDHFNPRNVRNNLADPQFGTFLNSYKRYFTGGFDILF